MEVRRLKEWDKRPGLFDLELFELVGLGMARGRLDRYFPFGVEIEMSDLSEVELRVTVEKKMLTWVRGDEFVVRFKDEGVGATRSISVQVLSNGLVLQLREERMLGFDLGGGKKLEVLMDMYEHRCRDEAVEDEEKRVIKIWSEKSGCYLYIFRNKNGELTVEECDTKRKKDGVSYRLPEEEERDLFELAGARWMGVRDFSLRRLVE